MNLFCTDFGKGDVNRGIRKMRREFGKRDVNQQVTPTKKKNIRKNNDDTFYEIC